MSDLLNCAQFGILLADYLDGTLAAGERDALLRHRDSCPECAMLAEDAEAALALMERVAEADPPPVLCAQILAATTGSWTLKLRSGGVRGWINRTFAPVLQPRVVMGVLLAAMSVAILLLGPLLHGDPRQNAAPLQADLSPARVWNALDNRTNRIVDRALHGYESMRLVYEVRTQLEDWRLQWQGEEEATADLPASERGRP